MAGSLWVQRRFCVYELLLTKEKFYEGTKGLCLHEDGYRSSGMDCAPIPWIMLSYHGSRGRPSLSGLALGRCHGCVRDNRAPSYIKIRSFRSLTMIKLSTIIYGPNQNCYLVITPSRMNQHTLFNRTNNINDRCYRPSSLKILYISY